VPSRFRPATVRTRATEPTGTGPSGPYTAPS
jgi:hypothetical protein